MWAPIHGDMPFACWGAGTPSDKENTTDLASLLACTAHYYLDFYLDLCFEEFTACSDSYFEEFPG